MKLLALIHALSERGSQFIIATHSPIVASYPHSWIYEFSEGPLKKVHFQEIAHFAVLKDFLNRPEAMLRAILSPEDRLT